MKFEAPDKIADAIALLAEDGARCLAGGQSLVAMMNADLVAPSILVSLRRIPGLAQICPRSDGGVSMGCMATHAAAAKIPPASAGASLVASAAGAIGHLAIRNQGTIGGSIAHADPAADYPTVLTCAKATIMVTGPDGERRIAAGDFFTGYYETAIRPGEMVSRIEVPPGPKDAGAHYEKFSLIDGDFAVVSVAAMIGMEGERCNFARIAIGACAPKPVRVPAAEERLVGSILDDSAFAEAGAIIVDACDPIDDFRGSASYRLRLVPRLVKRAALAAKAKATAHG